MKMQKSACLVLAFMATSVIPARAESPIGYRFRADLQGTTRLVAVPEGRCEDAPGQAPTVGLLEVSGAGESNLLGPVIDKQSHCVRQDGTFYDGRFTLTNAAGRTLRGRYFGVLDATFNASLSASGPAGPWLVKGEVCISGGDIVDVVNTCARGIYAPARGIANLSTGDATIFLDQTVKVR
jgi:hypothetical protein